MPRESRTDSRILVTTPRRMIVVDDDPKVRQLLERAFRPPEFETHSFPTRIAPITSLTQIKPDCVVSDILMPDMDGESLLRALRAVPGLEGVPFIALSAVRSEARIRSVIGAGADAFLLKPFPLRELTEKVRSLIERPQAARAARVPLGEDMQPTRPVMRAPHTMSTTSLRARGLAGLPPPPPDPPLEPDDVDVALARLTDPSATEPAVAVPVKRVVAAPPAEAMSRVRMGGPVRVVPPGGRPGEPVAGPRPVPAPAPPAPAPGVRHIEL